MQWPDKAHEGALFITFSNRENLILLISKVYGGLRQAFTVPVTGSSHGTKKFVRLRLVHLELIVNFLPPLEQSAF